MQTTGNTILITGGGSGIGRALAEAFHKLGNQVVIAGRRQELLDATTAANPGMASMRLDIDGADAIRAFAAQVTKEHPRLNVVIQNAGIMRNEKVQSGDVSTAEDTIATNLLGPIRLTAALLPHLLAQPKATLMTVSSGLAFVPLALAPTYSATKAAIHSYTQSLRYQLKDTAVEVLELIPPYVQTKLLDAKQAVDPYAMPLAEFIAEVMGILTDSPEATEIRVKRVFAQRWAERDGTHETMFKTLNDARSAAAKAKEGAAT